MQREGKFSDEELITAIKSKGQIEEAVKFMYKEYYRFLEQIVLQNQGNQADAEDVIQEVLIVFIDMIVKDKFRGEAKIRTMLYSLTKNIWLTELRKRSRNITRDAVFDTSQEKTEQEVTYYLAHKEARNDISDLFERLGESCKKLLTRFYFDNLPMKTILMEFGYENDQVLRNKKYKCMQKLMNMLNETPFLKQRLKSALQHG